MVNGLLPIIEERAMTEFLQALEGFFPKLRILKCKKSEKKYFIPAQTAVVTLSV